MTVFQKIIFSCIYFLISINSISVIAQFDNIDKKIGDHRFLTKYDTGNYTTSLKIYEDSDLIYKGSYEQYISDISEYDFNDDGKKEIIFDSYSGGAHCCFTVYAGKINKGKFTLTDSLYLGNSYYSVTDLNKDGKLELECSNDMFAYAFTNYAESVFPIMIYSLQKGKFKDVTSDFKMKVREGLNELLKELSALTDTGFKCEEIDEETFNTEAGTVKTILAAIVLDYHTLGEVQKGYDLVDSVYKCPDGDKYKLILQNDFKLK